MLICWQIDRELHQQSGKADDFFWRLSAETNLSKFAVQQQSATDVARSPNKQLIGTIVQEVDRCAQWSQSLVLADQLLSSLRVSWSSKV